MKNKSSLIPLVLSYVSFFPLILAYATATQGIGVVLSFIFWGLCFYFSIFLFYKQDSPNKNLFISIQVIIFMVLYAIMFHMSSTFSCVFIFAATSYLTLFATPCIKKTEHKLWDLIIALVFPYLTFVLYLPDILANANATTVPILAILTPSTFQVISLGFVGVVLTLGILCFSRLNNNYLYLGILLLHTFMIITMMNTMIHVMPPLIAFSFTHMTSTLRVILLGVIYSTLPVKGMHCLNHRNDF